ncbi:MAG TPA: AtpZ/AtpI family protein [Bdellovibrio sp.]|uniref:AtpZ/AtpI family protein n=1 Tax=Bdellovibrio sp. TaxID=28201 RepID=UPI002EEBED35
MRKYIIFASIGFELVGLILGCFFLDEFLDAKYQTKGLFFVGLSVLSLIGWLVRVIWLLKRFQDEDEKNPPNDDKV